MEAATKTSPRPRTTRERGTVEVDGETVRYEILVVDARSEQERAQGEVPAGNVIVVVPGHGQTVGGPRRLVAEFAALSRSKIAWCIDPTPAMGGDCTEARAIAHVVRHRLSHPTHSGGDASRQAIIAGWSHGGGEALRAASEDPSLFPQYLGLCPVGLVERRPAELIAGFLLEATRIMVGELVHGRWANVGETMRVGADFFRGLMVDLARSRSIRCVVNDVRWACRKVPGPDFDYPGDVVLLLGTNDGVIRWRDAFPECEARGDLDACAPAFQHACFPHSRRLEVRLVEGNHMAPELYPARFVRAGLDLVDQLA